MRGGVDNLGHAVVIEIDGHESGTDEDGHAVSDDGLVYLAHRERIRHVLTLDRRDFSVYRDWNNQPFLLLPEEIVSS